MMPAADEDVDDEDDARDRERHPSPLIHREQRAEGGSSSSSSGSSSNSSDDSSSSSNSGADRDHVHMNSDGDVAVTLDVNAALMMDASVRMTDFSAGLDRRERSQAFTPQTKGDLAPADAAYRVAAANESVEERVEELFPYYGDGTITAIDFAELLADVGINIDLEELSTYLVDPDQVALPEALEVVSKLTHHLGAHAESAIRAAALTTVQLSPWEYIKVKLTCSTHPQTEYRVRWDDLRPKPRTQLMGAIVVAVTVCCVLITMTVALQYDSYPRRPEDGFASAAGLTARNQLRGLEDAYLTAFSRAAASTARDVAALLAGSAATRGRNDDEHVRFRGSVVYGGVAAAMSSRHQRLRKALRSALFPAVSAETSTSSRHAAVQALAIAFQSPIFAELVAEGSLDVRVGDSTGTVSDLASPACPSCNVTATLCYAAATAQPNTVVTLENTPAYLGTPAALAVGAHYTRAGLTVCAFVSSAGLQQQAIASALAVVDTSFTVNSSTASSGTTGSFSNVVVRAAYRVSTANPVVIVPSQAQQSAMATCLAAFTAGQCNAQSPIIAAIASTIRSGASARANGSDIGVVSDPVRAYIASPVRGVVVFATQSVALAKNEWRREAIDVVETVNRLRSAASSNGTTDAYPAPELSLASLDAADGQLNGQVTQPKAPQDCLTDCTRLPVALLAQTAAFSVAEGTVVSLPQHNYAPRPVLAASTPFANMSLVVTAETLTARVRRSAAHDAARAFDAVAVNAYPWSVTLSHVASMPFSRVFDRSAACSPSLTCYESPVAGVLYRADCTDCESVAQLPQTTRGSLLADGAVQLLTSLSPHELAACATSSSGVSGCQTAKAKIPLYFEVLIGLPSRGEHLTDRDEVTGFMHRRPVLGTSSLDLDLAMSIAVAWPSSSYRDPAFDRLSLAVGLAPVILVVLLVLQMLFSHQVLHRIEAEWSQYTARIQKESQAFAEMVVDIFPIQIAERMMKGARRISDSHHVTLLFVNICQFETLYRSKMEPTILCLFTSYYYLLLSNVSQHFGLYRVRTFGDMVLIAGGVAEDKESSAGLNSVCQRTLQAASVLLELFSYQWSHTPSHVTCLRQISTSERSIQMPSVKIGAHVGPATILVEPNAVGPPVFDVVGANVGAAHAICSGAHTNTINASEAIIEGARRVGNFDQFQFDENQKRVSTRLGVIRTQLMRGANVPVPPRVVFALGIRRATVRVHFGQEGPAGDRGVEASPPGSTNDLGSVASSNQFSHPAR
jgi:hypothetical protein